MGLLDQPDQVQLLGGGIADSSSPLIRDDPFLMQAQFERLFSNNDLGG